MAAVLLTLWAYSSVWSAEWVYEDRAMVTTAHQPHTSWQRVLTYWTWQVAPTPQSAHVVNLALHGVVASLLGVLAWRLGLTPFGAWIVVLTWLLSPVVVETVVYAKARSEQLVILGALIAMLAASGRWWRPVGLLGICAGLLVAIGGEPSGVVVLLLVPLTVWHGRDRWHGAPSWWIPAIVAGVLVGAGIGWYGGLRAVINADAEAGIVSVLALTWQDWLLVQGGAVWYWLLATAWPALLTPDADMDGVPMWVRWWGLFTLVVISGVAWRTYRTHPVLALACLVFVVALVPRLLVQTPRSYLNAAQFAIPFLGVALAVGYGTQQWKAQWTQGA